MIPPIDEIVDRLLAGQITRDQAIAWLTAHAEGSVADLHDHFAGLMLPKMPAVFPASDGMLADATREAYRYADAMMAERAARRSKVMP